MDAYRAGEISFENVVTFNMASFPLTFSLFLSFSFVIVFCVFSVAFVFGGLVVVVVVVLVGG